VFNGIDNNKEDLIQDFVSIITSYCAKIYGRRRSSRKTEQLIKKLEEDNN
jgi:predicted site-specific integrase-resolvase